MAALSAALESVSMEETRRQTAHDASVVHTQPEMHSHAHSHAGLDASSDLSPGSLSRTRSRPRSLFRERWSTLILETVVGGGREMLRARLSSYLRGWTAAGEHRRGTRGGGTSTGTSIEPHRVRESVPLGRVRGSNKGQSSQKGRTQAQAEKLQPSPPPPRQLMTSIAIADGSVQSLAFSSTDNPSIAVQSFCGRFAVSSSDCARIAAHLADMQLQYV